ncbi:hypothetical protein JCGZ_00882 [Jatropha curcas]|uniref:Uncharacterized protein n=1 Tax=Jatropha curcas TaxID=180498 RepID=A0A067L3Q0_JATCU|nr:uncharacterized protein LOC105632953 [Jatropha curcas]KDP39125.1 hypothetical protein JCGZ_00882 [Jatropha curcas]
MGNCLRRESSMQWGGEDWGSPVPEKLLKSNKRQEKGLNVEEAEELLENQNKGLKSSSTEVKIKISKKQLQELLGRIDTKELSLEQVLGQLMKDVSSDPYDTHQRSWRPNLQSIPE